jgi:hypothetical protein
MRSTPKASARAFCDEGPSARFVVARFIASLGAQGPEELGHYELPAMSAERPPFRGDPPNLISLPIHLDAGEEVRASPTRRLSQCRTKPPCPCLASPSFCDCRQPRKKARRVSLRRCTRHLTAVDAASTGSTAGQPWLCRAFAIHDPCPDGGRRATAAPA